MTGSLREEIKSTGYRMDEMTVLSQDNDPYRLDTPANHKIAKWFKDQITAMGVVGTIHLRGCHYGLLGIIKPNGQRYENTDEDWKWLQEDAAKAARWLGYVPFDKIHDERNSPPIVHSYAPPVPTAEVVTGTGPGRYVPRHFLPTVETEDFIGNQPYYLVLWVEKSSPEPVLRPLAERYEADLYLGTGETSDTLVYQMAKRAAEMGKPLVVLTFSDADLSGHQMPISIARKLQALRTMGMDFTFIVHRVGLLPDQVVAYIDAGDPLPWTPLKETDRRIEEWVASHPKLVSPTGRAMGVELDALGTLRKADLEALTVAALDCYFDHDLASRVSDAEDEYLAEADKAITDALGETERQQMTETVTEHVNKINDLFDEIEEATDLSGVSITLPEIELPEAAPVSGPPADVLIDSSTRFPDWIEQTERLIEIRHTKS